MRMYSSDSLFSTSVRTIAAFGWPDQSEVDLVTSTGGLWFSIVISLEVNIGAVVVIR